MTTERPGIHRSESIEDLHHLRLMALLDELVRDKGPRQAAADLDVDHRTLAASLESGRLTRRMRVALDRALLAGGGTPAEEQRERNDLLAGRLERVEELAQETGAGLAAVQGEVEAHGQALRSIEGRLAGVESAKAPPSPTFAATPSQPPSPPRPPRREFPELATLEPAADDEQVFGDAWPLIQEWRELRESHPDRGKGLDWLREEERLMTVELALLDDHGLTLPPQDYPLTGLNRNNQTNWRRTTLAENPPGLEAAGTVTVAVPGAGAAAAAVAQVDSVPKGPVPIRLTLARWGAHGLPRVVGKPDNICVVRLFQSFPP